MRLAHLLRDGEPRLAVGSSEGWVDVAASADGGPATLSDLLHLGEEGLAAARRASAGPVVSAPEFGSLLDCPGRIICVGRNYREHRDEMGNEESPWPETFLRLASTAIGPFDEVRIPSFSHEADYEGELGLVIGRGGRHIPAAEAEGAIFGYTIVNDVSIRDWQRRGQQWTPGKNFDGTLPIGPHLVTTDELDWRDLQLRTRLNGQTVQSASTSQLIFDVPALIAFISTWTTLLPGDLICTGTPGGVGVARKPPLFLRSGDLVEVEIEGIGTLRNRVIEDGFEVASQGWLGVS